MLSMTKPDLLFTLFTGKVATGIRLHNVDIPPHAIRGQNARLTCKYDMEGDKLYSIKWYRNGHEFYRYIPSDNPSTTIFNGNGINVDKSQSSEEEILLRSVDLDTTGLCKTKLLSF